ncbi:MAG: LuxR C-terminal-related transcriptional regulator [Desulfovibrio sp.]|jgi:LuxR family maltose regulon positive regulatory protein|nr:LuxR C-terminal-related transcriptional regulator [Desulfovibrio sp.]
MNRAREAANATSLYFSERLLNALAVLLETPLTIVEAPVGYGKTTAVREFLNKNKVQRLWVPVLGSLSGVSEDAFWRVFCREIGRSLPEASDVAASLERLGYPSDSTRFETARELLHQLNLSVPTVLVIDDFHLLPSPAFGMLCEVLSKEALAGTGIVNLHIALVSRYVYPGEKELLRLKGALAVVGQETFAFSVKDIQSYYALHKLDITPEQARALHTATAGWISGLYIQLLLHRKRGVFSLPVSGMLASSGNNGGAVSSEDRLPPEQAALLEKEIYAPLPPEIKNLLFALCPLERFTAPQADFLFGGDTRALLAELTRQNSFVAFDRGTGIYSMHAIFRHLLTRLFQDLPVSRQKAIHRRCGDWFAQEGEFVSAMGMYCLVRDFEKALTVMEQDMSRNLVTENATFFTRMFQDCPEDVVDRHPGAAFKHALAALSACDFPAFGNRCARLAAHCAAMPENDPQTRVGRGELELLLALTAYNDIAAMSAHHRKAWELLGRPTGLYPPESTWAMGCPSVLFMFHRKSGALAHEIRLMRESMPPYYRVTSHHGAGGEYLFESEALYHAGDFTGASVACYKAEEMAGEHRQIGNLICALFLRLRLAVASGDLPGALERIKAMRDAITKSRDYFLLHTVGLCTGWLYAILGLENSIPRWIGATADTAVDNRMYAFARGSWFLVHGRALLLAGQYEKVTGLFGRLLESGLFDKHNVFFIYAHIYLAAAQRAPGGTAPAVKYLRTALDAALPDNLLMPFVENSSHILPLLQILKRDRRREGVRRILDLAENWNTGLRAMDAASPRYRLTPQQMELVRLAAVGKNFKEIAMRTGLAHGTVKNKFTALYKRFGVHGAKELLDKVTQAGVSVTPYPDVQL